MAAHPAPEGGGTWDPAGGGAVGLGHVGWGTAGRLPPQVLREARGQRPAPPLTPERPHLLTSTWAEK